MDGAPLKVSEGGEVEGGLEDGRVAALGLVQDEQGVELHIALKRGMDCGGWHTHSLTQLDDVSIDENVIFLQSRP